MNQINLPYSYYYMNFIRSFILILIGFDTVICSNHRLAIYPENDKIDVRLKEPFSVKCKPLGDNPSSFSEIHWNGPNVNDNWMELEKRHKVVRSRSDGSAKLMFNGTATIDDSGIYTCQASYQSTEVLSRKIKIEFYNPIEVKDCNDNQFVVFGQNDAQISCSVTSFPGPTVEISKDNIDISKFLNRYIYENNDHLRIASNVDQSDKGDYKIIFFLDAYGQTLERNIHVEVFMPPTIIPPIGLVFRGIEGQEAVIRCNASGYPQPRVLWLDAKKRNVSSVGGYHVDPEAGTLKIEKVSLHNDDGNFTCIAENQAGQVDAAILMTVDVRPSISLFTNQTVQVGALVTLECRSNGRPKPIITIRKNGFPAFTLGDGYFKESYQLIDHDIHVYQLTLMNVQKSLGGLLFCNSSNDAGYEEREAYLNVEFKPDLGTTLPIQYIKPSKIPVVVCRAEAYPEPIVKWYYNDVQLINIDQTVVRTPDLKSHIFTIVAPSNTTGTFRCVATNKLGDGDILIKLEYSRPPGIVDIIRQEVGPTHVKLQLNVNDDGGEEIHYFIYEFVGTSAIRNSPFSFNQTEHREKYRLPVLSLSKNGPYFIRNLRPRYDYGIQISAQNDVGLGMPSSITFTTSEPTRPNKPIITTPHRWTDSIVTSRYSNGYKLFWSEPESNGNNITKYVISYREVDKYSSNYNPIGDESIIEQLRERPTYALLGPLKPGSIYNIHILAINEVGTSDFDSLLVNILPDKPKLPEFSGLSLDWFVSEQAPLGVSLFILFLAMLMLLIDLTCCYFFQVGILHVITFWLYPYKTRVANGS